jgi:hypothetical protein
MLLATCKYREHYFSFVQQASPTSPYSNFSCIDLNSCFTSKVVDIDFKEDCMNNFVMVSFIGSVTIVVAVTNNLGSSVCFNLSSDTALKKKIL